MERAKRQASNKKDCSPSLLLPADLSQSLSLSLSQVSHLQNDDNNMDILRSTDKSKVELLHMHKNLTLERDSAPTENAQSKVLAL